MDFSELPADVPKEKFRMTANKLLNECFLLKCCEDTKKSYYYVLNHKELFASFFDLLGYEINIIEEFGMISLSNSFGTGRQVLFFCCSDLFISKSAGKFHRSMKFLFRWMIYMKDIKC